MGGDKGVKGRGQDIERLRKGDNQREKKGARKGWAGSGSGQKSGKEGV